MVLKFIKSLFKKARSRSRIDEILLKFESHRPARDEFKTWLTRDLYKIEVSYKNKIKILNIKERHNYLARTRQVVDSLQSLINTQFESLRGIKQLLSSSTDEMSVIQSVIHDYDRTLKHLLGELRNGLAIVQQYEQKLTTQTSALEAKDLDISDKELWDEQEKIKKLKRIFAALNDYDTMLQIHIKTIIKAKKILDSNLPRFNSKLESMTRNYIQGDWGMLFTSGGKPLENKEVKNKIHLRYATFDKWREGFMIFLEYLKKDMAELFEIFNAFQRSLLDDYSANEAMKEYYKEELDYVYSSFGKFSNLLEGSERLDGSMRWNFDPDKE